MSAATAQPLSPRVTIVAAIKAPINVRSFFMRESSLRPKDKYGPRPKGIGARARAWILNFGFCPAVAGSLMRGKMRNSKCGNWSRSRDPACAGKFGPTTLLTRFAEELRRVLGIKPRQEPRTGRGRYGARTRGLRKKGGRFKAGGGRGA